jgi:hypothetical protein
MTSEDTTVNISSRLMFGLGQAGADWKWTSDTTTIAEPDPIVVEQQTTDDGLSDLDDLYEYYSQVLR